MGKEVHMWSMMIFIMKHMRVRFILLYWLNWKYEFVAIIKRYAVKLVTGLRNM